ncbi:MAG: serine hydrolase domain-containing protein [Bryobacteraceae bacterium]
MRFSLCIAFLVLAGLPSRAASVKGIKPEDAGISSDRLLRIHETIQRHIDSHQISGAVTLVARKGRLVHLEAHGLMDLDSKKPMEKNSIFRIFSMSKPVAGVAVLMLMEEGKIRLNDPVSKFIPEFEGMKVAVARERPAGPAAAGGSPSAPLQFYTVPALREITIQDLLTHVSGLGSGPASSAQMQGIARKPDEKLADYIPRLGTTPLDFQPGSRWTYSPGAAFDTLGRIVEIVSGQPFDRFLRERIFDPLGMKNAFFYPSEDLWPLIPTAYHRSKDSLRKTENQNRLVSKTYFSGAGGLLAGAEEYALFGEMLLEGGQLNGKRLLSPRTVELMRSVFVPDTLPGRAPGRAFGLSVQVITDPVAAGYRVSPGSFGWDGAFGTHFWVDPKEKIVGILMIQTDNPNRQLDRDFENAVMQSIVE